MEATSFQSWVTMVLGVLGFGITWTIGVVGLTRAVEKIKLDTSEKIAAASEHLMSELADMRADFLKDQKAQDHNFGEVGAAMRQYIANVEKEMHEIEIWGRDNFVLRSDFTKATDRLEDAIKSMAAGIRTDIRDLTAKIDAKN